ncbi:hypothetical protein [Methylobacterium brachiatum]|uniref:hypothetical protein n=1 Tax=Methylobacterium brachiatum TaxID=269660 RepID=UPI000EFC3AC0|nr:hypothetical protein [Methylobacterium brachiatum]AYO84049.1 hypothetical protein EBB05_18450 [Methylobacterium brachiatum]
MPDHSGRPKQYDGKTAEIKFKIGENYYTDVQRYARDHGLSVPFYVAMMIHSHVNKVRRAEKNEADGSE